MGFSPLRSINKTSYHARSISLPSRLNHASSIPQFKPVSESSLPLISNRLNSLQDVYDCFDHFFLLPHTQQAFAQPRHQKLVDDAMNAHLRLLDICNTTKDILLYTKQNTQDLLSVLRRRRESNELGGYLASRKIAKKVAQKSLKDFKTTKNKQSNLSEKHDESTLAIVAMLNEAETVTLEVLESLLSYIAGRKAQSKSRSLVSKLMGNKRVVCQDEETNVNEFDKIDAELQLRKSENVQDCLGKIMSNIEDLERGLEPLFRCLIKTRVSLLNILNR